MGKGGGGGLAFLNKKSWHPGGFKQQEDVWKREQAKAEEDKRLEELRKQINEEREHQELLRVAREAGHVFKEERLEFMYKGPMAEGPGLGGAAPAKAPPVQPPAPPEAAQPAAGAAHNALSVYVDDTPKARNEAWARLHADPMLMIKQQEQAQLKSIRANPVKMDSIMKEVESLKAARRAEKDAKRAKKEAKRETKRRHRSRSRSSTDSRGRRQRDGGDRDRPAHRRRSSSREGDHAHARGRHSSRSRERRRSRSDDGRARGDHRRGDEPPRSPGSRGGDRHRDESHGRRRSRSRDARGREGQTQHSSHPAGNDGALAQRGVSSYGLTYASTQAEEAARMHAAASRDRPAYVPAKAPKAAPPSAWQAGRNSVRHNAGGLTDEDRAQRLAAMAADASDHDAERWNRLRAEAQRTSADASLEQHAPSHHHSVKPQFLGEQERQLFGASSRDDGAQGALADRIGTRKHFQERGTGDGM